MIVSDETVEETAKAICGADNCNDWLWSELANGGKRCYRAMARAALEAAIPKLIAAELRAQADDMMRRASLASEAESRARLANDHGGQWEESGRNKGFREAANRLRARADELDGGA